MRGVVVWLVVWLSVAGSIGCAIDRSGLGGEGSDAGGVDGGRSDVGPGDPDAASDAGPDAGPDAGDGGPPPCEPARCDDSVACTVDGCDPAGACEHLPSDGLCTAMPNGTCDATGGCQYPVCTDATCAPDDGCSTAVCVADTCVRTTSCGTGEVCCAGSCVAPGCDDSNPCTDDACGAGGCEHTDNAASCDDGAYCNGADACAGGACASAGDPCGGLRCDEASDACVECLSAGDCTSPGAGPWSVCGGFASECATEGMQSRMVGVATCLLGACSVTTTTETRPCTRSTEGMLCGSPGCSPWGACGGFSSTCDQTGSQSRSCTAMACAGGACSGGATGIESRSCTRDTNGSDCELDGRSCTADVCSGGSCTHPCRSGCSCYSSGACGGGWGC